MHKVQIFAMIVGSLAMVALVATSARAGMQFRSASPLGPVQVWAIVAISLAAALSIATLAWATLKTGVVEHQRTLDRVPVSRTATPTYFWMHVAILLTLAAGFVWFAVHVVGYGLGWWSWSIEF